MPGAPATFDPNSNGAANLTAPPSPGAEPVTDDPMASQDAQPVTDDTSPRVAAMTMDILRDNPDLQPRLARRLAERAFSEYLVKEPGWESNPLAVVAARDLEDPDRPLTPVQERVEGQGEPLPPQRPTEPVRNREGVL